MSWFPFFRNSDTRWGPGTGAGIGGKLTSLQEDENVFGAYSWLVELAALAPNEIADITFSGNAITIELTGGGSKGPFPLPVAQLHPAGEWGNDQTYHYLDIVNVGGFGLFLVNIDHVTPSAPAGFNPLADDGSTAHNLLYTQWGPSQLFAKTATLAGDSHTLSLSDVGRFYECAANDTGGVTTITIPLDDDAPIPTDAEISFLQRGNALNFVLSDASIALNFRNDRVAATDTVNAAVMLKKTGANAWALFGDLAAPP